MKPAALLALALLAAPAQARSPLAPPFTIWDVKLGEPVTQIPVMEVTGIGCGTNGGPLSTPLKTPADFRTCPPEPSGLRELRFSHDDEMAYIAKAMSTEYKLLEEGTTVFSYPVLISALVDDTGIVQGIRIVTDPTAVTRERRKSVSLIRNLQAKYASWSLACTDIPPAEGEEPLGELFIHQTCTGATPDGAMLMRADAAYLRKKGQEAMNPDTRKVDPTHFESFTRFEQVLKPFAPTAPPGK